MSIDVGNKETGVTETEAAQGKQALNDQLTQWWERAKQLPTIQPEKLSITWGALSCDLELNLDQAKQPQITFTGTAPRSIKEAISQFLKDTCKVANVEEHFHHRGLDKKVFESIGKNDFDVAVGALTKYYGMFRTPQPSEAPKPEVSPSQDRQGKTKGT